MNQINELLFTIFEEVVGGGDRKESEGFQFSMIFLSCQLGFACVLEKVL